jgi:hypothetical protein
MSLNNSSRNYLHHYRTDCDNRHKLDRRLPTGPHSYRGPGSSEYIGYGGGGEVESGGGGGGGGKHSPATHSSPTSQRWKQRPQCLSFLCTLTHLPLQHL